MLVGVARVDRFGGLRNAQMFQLAFATGQASTDLAQRVRPRELTEQHGHELAPTGEAASVPPGPMLAHSLLALDAREQLRKLRQGATETLYETPRDGRDGFQRSPQA